MRIGWVLLFLFLAPALYALDVTVGSSFKILNIARVDGKIHLPIERDKYYNIRILNKETFDFVRTCAEPCRQAFTDVVVQVQEMRPAKTRENMWLATVSFKNAWAVTFLVFKRGEKYAVKFPEHFVFLDNALRARMQTAIVKAVEEIK